MKLYTKTGDKGQTGLFSGQLVRKADLRVNAYGDVDELNSVIGWCNVEAHKAGQTEMVAVLTRVQSRLFEIGADLATPRPADGEDVTAMVSSVPRVGLEQVTELECHLDRNSEKVKPMKSFILPGGTELASRLHIARTVCRRAERLVVALAEREPIGPFIVQYLNRLSDLLFAMAREANQDAGVDDVPWHNATK